MNAERTLRIIRKSIESHFLKRYPDSKSTTIGVNATQFDAKRERKRQIEAYLVNVKETTTHPDPFDVTAKALEISSLKDRPLFSHWSNV